MTNPRLLGVREDQPGALRAPVPGRSAETGVSERVLYRKIAAFRKEGMESLFSSPKAKRRVLPLAIRRKIVDLKAEHPRQARGPAEGRGKVDLRAMVEARRLQENPELGEFRVQAALEQLGIHLSRRTVGRILATNREAEGLEKPSRGRKEKREMPFAASFRHEYWTSDVRYVSHSIPETGQAYVVAVLENYSRAVLASAVTLSQDTNAYLSVLHAAIGRYGSPGTIVTDGGGVFRSDRAKAVYAALGIVKLEIERGQAWQSFIETNFNLQRRLADHFFSQAQTWEELVAEHDLWLQRHNTQRHSTHEKREDGRRSPAEVLGPVRVVRHHPSDLSRAFFSTMLVRRLTPPATPPGRLGARRPSSRPCSATRRRFSADPLPTGSGAGGAPVAQSSGVATLSLLPSESLISISRAHEASSTSAPNSPAATTTTKALRLTTTPAHHETRIAPAFEEQLRELL